MLLGDVEKKLFDTQTQGFQVFFFQPYPQPVIFLPTTRKKVRFPGTPTAKAETSAASPNS
jgi:hypothetical protein